MRQLAICIMAAGQGKRMGRPDSAKVLTPLDSQPLLGYVLDCALELSPDYIVVIVGHQRQAVTTYAQTKAPFAQFAVQEQQLGTGHAIQQAQPFLEGHSADVVILSGDVPLLTSATLQRLINHHRTSNAALTILTTTVTNPTGYGRILRDGKGAVAGIVEHKDATDEQRLINEINSGIYVVKNEILFHALNNVENSNAQGEFYLTDIAGILLADGAVVEAMVTSDSDEVHGINTPDDLAAASSILLSKGIV